ncbi:ATP-binding protein [Mesorhizobium sp. M0074]|uniref:ATP-binding protein n=1 Tax=Mesorhizobium sp. M0074 TaxID=2956869 RepID=UPI003335B53F
MDVAVSVGAVSDADHMFGAFVTTRVCGRGMGFSICRSIIEAHGGRLWAWKKFRGSIFHFTVPSADRDERP